MLPVAYMIHFFPIRIVYQFDEIVVAAGSLGFVVYSRRNSRWRLFGNEQQEKTFRVTAMTDGFGMLILAVQTESSYEIWVMDVGKTLELANIVSRQKFESEVRDIGFYDNHLLVLSDDLSLWNIGSHPAIKWNCLWREGISASEARMCPADSAETKTTDRSIIVLRMNGELGLVKRVRYNLVTL